MCNESALGGQALYDLGPPNFGNFLVCSRREHIISEDRVTAEIREMRTRRKWRY